MSFCGFIGCSEVWWPYFQIKNQNTWSNKRYCVLSLTPMDHFLPLFYLNFLPYFAPLDHFLRICSLSLVSGTLYAFGFLTSSLYGFFLSLSLRYVKSPRDLSLSLFSLFIYPGVIPSSSPGSSYPLGLRTPKYMALFPARFALVSSRSNIQPPIKCFQRELNINNVTHIVFSGILAFSFGFLELIKANLIEAIAQAAIWGQSQVGINFLLFSFSFSSTI